uniref:Uncharacterized protein n=1 Tax=Cacopsylla melanoneura TaxID=428564 RepID=A0A8D8VUV3_9HEMI
MPPLRSSGLVLPSWYPWYRSLSTFCPILLTYWTPRLPSSPSPCSTSSGSPCPCSPCSSHNWSRPAFPLRESTTFSIRKTWTRMRSPMMRMKRIRWSSRTVRLPGTVSRWAKSHPLLL